MLSIENIINKLKAEQAFNEEAIVQEIDTIVKSLGKHLDEKYEMEKKFALEFQKMFESIVKNVRSGYSRDHFDSQEPPLPSVVTGSTLTEEQQNEILAQMDLSLNK